MSHNNPLLFNAALAGTSGTIEQCWLTTANTALPSLAEVIANAIDAAIPTIVNGATASQAELLQSICEGVFTGRYPVSTSLGNYSVVANAIANTFIALNSKLDSLSPDYYAQNWAVTDWYIDGVTGLDTNNGTSVTTPLKTGAELLRRLGSYAIWDHSVTIHVGVNGMTDPLVVRGNFTIPGGHVDVFGTPTVLATDIVSAYTPYDHTTPKGTHLTGTAIADFSPYQWKRVRVTAGVQVGATAWIACANPAGTGLNVARITIPARILSTGYSYTAIFTINDTFVIESLPEIPIITIEVDSPLLDTTIEYDKRLIQINSISTPYLSTGTNSANHVPQRSYIFGNRISEIGTEKTLFNGLNACSLVCCSLYRAYNPTDPNGIYSAPSVFSSNCLYGDNYQAAGALIFESSVFISSSLFQGCSCTLATSSLFRGINIQIFDITSSITAALSSDNANISGLSGTGNVGYGIKLINGSRIFISGTPNLGGTAGIARLSTAPAIILDTLAKVLAGKDDFVQSGTATLVGGTVVVTPTYFNSAVQKITLTRNTPGGTIGDLSAPAASRTATGFTINSSNALDTSTVDWQISPLGRNIFIST